MKTLLTEANAKNRKGFKSTPQKTATGAVAGNPAAGGKGFCACGGSCPECRASAPSGELLVSRKAKQGPSGPKLSEEQVMHSGTEVTIDEGGTSGLAGAWKYGQIPNKPEVKQGSGTVVQLPPAAKPGDPPQAETPIYPTIGEARAALRELFFIEGTALELLGEHGTAGEFIGGIAEVKVGNTTRFALVGVGPGEEEKVGVNVSHFKTLAKRLAGGRGKLREIIHTHPSGLRAFFEHGAGTDQFSGPDRDFPKATGVPLGLLTPTGAMKLLRPGRKDPQPVLPEVPQPKRGRKEFVPDRPDLKALIEKEIDQNIEKRSLVEMGPGVFDLLHLDQEVLDEKTRRKLEKKRDRLLKKKERALKGLEKM